MRYENLQQGIEIVASDISIGKSVEFGQDISVKIRGLFKIGDYSRLGDNTHIRGNNVSFGKHLFNSSGLRIGGGGRQHPHANFGIGDRCTIHNNLINICEPVVIGNDVGLSPEVSIMTHGYWQSVLEGYPAKFAGVTIEDGVIVGYRSLILMGVRIAKDIVIGAQSVVTKDLVEKGIYGGSPAKFLNKIVPLGLDQQIAKLEEIFESYKEIAFYHGITPFIKIDYPMVFIRGFQFNAETFEYIGQEDEETDDLRDYIRKFGIRIYTTRPFKSIFEVQ